MANCINNNTTYTTISGAYTNNTIAGTFHDSTTFSSSGHYDAGARAILKAIMITMDEEQVLQIIALCPEAIELIDEPTEAMLEMVKARDL